MDNPMIKKPRSLKSKDEGGWSGDNSHKHFRVNGASPDEGPSNGKSKTNRSMVCRHSLNKEHHYEIQCDAAMSYRERMIYICSYCGRKGDSFYVNIGPLPEWLKRLQERFNV